MQTQSLGPGEGALRVPRIAYGCLPLGGARDDAASSSETLAKATAAKERRAPAELPDHARPVFERLRAWRAATAREQGVPAYVVFHDATLRDIALRLPATLQELGAVSGVGESKLARYGRQVQISEPNTSEPLHSSWMRQAILV